MVVAALDTSQDVVERHIRLTGEFTRFVLDNPQVLDALPEKFELVILPDNDPELEAYSLHLLNQRQATLDRPVVFVWLRTKSNGASHHEPSFQFFVPVAA